MMKNLRTVKEGEEEVLKLFTEKVISDLIPNWRDGGGELGVGGGDFGGNTKAEYPRVGPMEIAPPSLIPGILLKPWRFVPS